VTIAATLYLSWQEEQCLDRQNAMLGYTVENVTLICRDCDEKLQESRSYIG